ncbi:MAG: ATP-binding protein [Marinoscillum sp.]
MRRISKLTWVVWLMGSKLLLVLAGFYLWISAVADQYPEGALDTILVVILVLFVLSIPFTYFLTRYLLTLLTEQEKESQDVEAQLVDFSARLNSFIEHPEHVSIYSLDRNYHYTGFNSLHQKEMKEVFHQECEVGKNILELLPKEMSQRTKRNFDRALTGDHFQVTSLFMDKYFTQIFNPVFDQDDQVIGLTSSIFDVTERIIAEQELESYKDQLEDLVKDRTRQLERQTLFFQEIIDSLPNLIFVRDKKSRYVLVNKAMADSFGQKTGEVVGKTVLETHYDKKEALRFEEEDLEVIRHDDVIEQESFHKHKDGTGRWLFLSKRRMKVFDEDFVLGVHFDINNLKETELKLLEANQELKNTLNRLKSAQMRLIESEKMASLGQLTAGLAHEINNPINYVAGNVRPIRRDIRELKDYLDSLRSFVNSIDGPKSDLPKDSSFEMLFEELESLLDGVDEGTTRVKNLMSDLNAFSLPETSKKQLCNINESINTTVNLIKHHLKDRISLTLKLSELPDIICNPSQLSQVFLNMLNNAIQAIEETGKITVSTKLTKKNIVIKIKDTGSGISKANMSKIFNPFFTTKDVGEGTGLGLAISYRIIEEHKGSIEVESEEGVGTEFKIVLPVNRSVMN